MTPAATTRDALADLLDEVFHGKAWHGPSLRGALRGVTPAQALWRPAPRRHCIWELVLHAVYWKSTVTRRLLGTPRGGFPRAGSNWLPVPAPADTRAWRRDLALLAAQHAALRAAVRGFPATRLARVVPGARWRYRQLIAGSAAHDAYHTGQIQLLKRLQAPA